MTSLQLWGISVAKMGNLLCNSVPFNYAIHKMLDDDNFIYKIQYNQAREVLEQFKAKQKSTDAALLDLL